MSSQWRPLQPGLENGGRMSAGGQQSMSRQITKNPQNMMQNFQASNNGYGNFGGGSGFSSSMLGGSGGGMMGSSASNGGLTNSQSTGRLSGLSAFPEFSGNALDSPSAGGAFSSLSPNSYSHGNGGRHQASDYRRDYGMSNGFGYDHQRPGYNSSSNFDRQMSVPTNLSEHNGHNKHNNGYSGRSTDFYGMFGRSNSPPSGRNPGGFNEMKIGTWNEPNPSAAENGSGNNALSAGNNGFSSVGNFEIGTFNISSSTANNSANNGYDNNNSGMAGGPKAGPGIRETGIIEKLLHSYGFIQCCDRQARLFFHFSQFDGTIEHLKIGDPVEFEMTYDRRTGKPIASSVSKIAPDVVMNEERVIGTVTTEARIDSETGAVTHGRISYENRGECFFLPFTLNDVEGNVTVAAGDKCSFRMATLARSGNLVAQTIRLENPASPVKYQGVITSVDEAKAFGYIERADVVRDILFHYTEVADGEVVDKGDDVEFTIQTRNGKEVACSIMKLPAGTVIFEDVGKEYFRGQVLKPLDRNLKFSTDATATNDALNGRVKYRAVDRSEREVLFGEKDQVGDFTLKHGDWIKFVIAVDRRDKVQRATKIELLVESFQVSDERRETGMVQQVVDGTGFIRCADRDADRMPFRFSECLDVSRSIAVGDEVEFTVSSDMNQPGAKLVATRIKHLSPGSVVFDAIIHKDATGKVEIEPSWSIIMSKESEDGNSKEGVGKILYELNGLSLEIPLHATDCDLREFPNKDDMVHFDINQLKSTKETRAVNVRIVETRPNGGQVSKDQQPGREIVQQGYIAALKDGFGFIETLEHDKEIFFHFSNMKGNKSLEVGMEVEYSLFNRDKAGGKVSAENIKALRKGSIPPIPTKENVVFHGKVLRPLRSVNPDQSEYCGLMQAKSEDGTVLGEHRFGIASLLNKKELLQIGDSVQYQVDINGDFAVNIQATREKLRAVVETMKGQFGFLSYEVDEGKKLFFHTSEVEGNVSLQIGDEVEFVVVTNTRTGRHSACCVRKLSSSQRPERLISKLKTMNLEDAARLGKKIQVIRQPKGPDGTKGFAVKRVASSQ